MQWGYRVFKHRKDALIDGVLPASAENFFYTRIRCNQLPIGTVMKINFVYEDENVKFGLLNKKLKIAKIYF